MSEALIFASINPKYDNRFFVELFAKYFTSNCSDKLICSSQSRVNLEPSGIINVNICTMLCHILDQLAKYCVDQNMTRVIKFIYSEKATKFCEIFPLLLTTVRTVVSKGKISQNFVAAFSE